MDEMNARERVLAAIKRQPADRLPTDIWATGEVWAKVRAPCGDGVDLGAQLHRDGFGGVGAAYLGLTRAATRRPPRPGGDGEHGAGKAATARPSPICRGRRAQPGAPGPSGVAKKPPAGCSKAISALVS
jgi:hypothetical protein